ncbi:hypothetical protein K450DRAFT_218525 [Umbelopsis ramanniana AG]|uniref:Uncharacterized protein n=1 Tax=Umbelopsis ramanniana AG TaxID=1314678 RepID=A0AAD5HIL6_UMBRA|nr:uncharacterized protein K450DRAFT_218525 [Umbelopsis ramanniana AG]KAI8584174.1 hypothetical protein K450DRAFT_218525 [Umbelopsis ramanniana AG]
MRENPAARLNLFISARSSLKSRCGFFFSFFFFLLFTSPSSISPYTYNESRSYIQMIVSMCLPRPFKCNWEHFTIELPTVAKVHLTPFST